MKPALKTLLRQKGLTVVSLADRLGVSRQTAYRYLQGQPITDEKVRAKFLRLVGEVPGATRPDVTVVDNPELLSQSISAVIDAFSSAGLGVSENSDIFVDAVREVYLSALRVGTVETGLLGLLAEARSR